MSELGYEATSVASREGDLRVAHTTLKRSGDVYDKRDFAAADL